MVLFCPALKTSFRCWSSTTASGVERCFCRAPWMERATVFFVELEDELLQGEVTSETAGQLYVNYLHKVDSVSQLEIMGMYRDIRAKDDVDTLHVFGRTKGVSHRHFYRRCENGSEWTPWEPLDLDINSDHLIPVVGNSLCLFWPEFTQSDNPNATIVSTTEVESDPERADEIRAEIVDHEQRIDEIDALLSSTIVDSPNFKGDTDALASEKADHQNAIESLEDELDALTVEKTSTKLGDKYLMEIRMKWSEYQNGRWLGEKVSKDKISYTTSDNLSRHYFTGWVGEDGVLRISARINKLGNGEGVDAAHSPEGYLGYFYFDGYGGNLAATSVEVTDPVGDVTLTGSLPEVHSAAWFDTWWSSDSLELQISDAAEKRLLIKSAGNLYYAHQDGQYGKEGFFFSDGVRTYFVQPCESSLFSSIGSMSIVARRFAAGKSNKSTKLLTSSSGRALIAIEQTPQHFGTSNASTILDRSLLDKAYSSSLATTTSALLEADSIPTILAGTGTIATSLRYKFTRFYHPHTSLFLKQHYRYGVDGLLNPDPAWGTDSAELYRQLLPSNEFDFKSLYQPNTGWVYNNFSSERLDEQIDFDHQSPYGCYNWELFFHAPLLIATRLMQNQRYADARCWLHYIFDPTSTDGVGPERFWKIKPFFQEQQTDPQQALQLLLSAANSTLEQQVEQWELDPFNPHLLARMRINAYMQVTVMRYLDCLLKEADALFLRDTREDVNEARQLYLLAAEILGDRPSLLPSQEASTLTPNLLLGRFKLDWNDLLGRGPLDALTSILTVSSPGAPSARASSRVMPGPMIIDAAVGSNALSAATVSAQGGAGSVDTLLLFCVPHNEMLYGYWDTVADHLFKVRHCMNLSGQVRQLALFAPPIDPALLVRASAAGLSIEAILSGLYAPRSNYRFSFMLQKALEICSDARSLGGALLAALEKKDGEELSLLRSAHEIAVLESIRAVKQKSVDEAQASLAGLLDNRESAQLRASFYAGLERISTGEQKSLDKQEDSRHWQAAAEGFEVLASLAHVIPTATSTGPQFGGPHLGAASQAVAGSLRARSAFLAYAANKAGITAGYRRRFDDWRFQLDLANKEIEQLDKQILAAEIRKQIAETDLANHDKQIADAKEVEDFLKLKFTDQQLYSWMVSKLASVHF
jgi:Neuraminidase-like domain/Tc toxin complex TcA C-terminal TcB-binding domain